MFRSHRVFSALFLTAALAASAHAEDSARADTAAAVEAADGQERAPAPMMGMRRHMAGMAGEGMGQHCKTGKGRMAEPAPCKSGRCPTGDAEHRLDALEKRLDLMQTMLEMLVRQQARADK